MRGLRFLCAVVVLTAVSKCLVAQPFFFRKDIPVDTTILSAVVGDFNGDHRPDIAVFTRNEGAYTLLNRGAGNFSKPVRAGVYSNAWKPGLPLAADFNGDGKDDLVTATVSISAAETAPSSRPSKSIEILKIPPRSWP